jgi:hypothetical protein
VNNGFHFSASEAIHSFEGQLIAEKELRRTEVEKRKEEKDKDCVKGVQ